MPILRHFLLPIAILAGTALALFPVGRVPKAWAGSPSYTLDDIAAGAGVLSEREGEDWSYAINANGWVAGTTGTLSPNDGRRAFLWEGSGAPIDLGTLVKGNTGLGIGLDLNSSGTVVGWATAKSNDQAFRYSNGTMTDLGSFDRNGLSFAEGINDSGLIVGESSSANGSAIHAFEYDTTMHDLGTLPGDTDSMAYAINSSGTIVGRSDPAYDGENAFVYAGGVMSQLAPLSSSYPFADASDINDGGIIIGDSMYAANLWHAVYWDATSHAIHDLTPTVTRSVALGINNNGDIVGMADDRAFLYSNGQYIDLTDAFDPSGDSGWILEEAYDINDNGQIVGVGTLNGQNRVFRLSPAPLNIAPPTVSGNPVVGSTLTLTPGTWQAATSITDQWQRCGLDGSGCSNITGATGATYVVSSSDVDERLIVGEIASNAYGSNHASSLRTDPVVTNQLLLEYAPLLKEDSNESYTPDNAAEITDYAEGSTQNLLYESTGSPRSGPLYPGSSKLSLLFLSQNSYGDGQLPTPTSADYIKEAGDPQEEYGYLFNSNPDYYGWKTYGRVVPDGNDLVLQYWFFYYYNTADDVGAGAHEGDWEGMQIVLQGGTTPGPVTYFEHRSGQTCPWGPFIQTVGTHVVVYVAAGSHASYPQPGDYPIQEIYGLLDDHADGDGPSATPAVIDISAPSPPWVGWPGYWGGSLGQEFYDEDSPTGPAYHTQWGDPEAWAQANTTDCTTPPDARAVPLSRTTTAPPQRITGPKPPRPTLTARLGRTVIRVHYRFSTWPLSPSRHPALLFVSTLQRNPKSGRPTTVVKLRGRSGHFSQPLGLARTPYRLVYTVVSTAGTRTSPATVGVAIK